MTQEADRDLVAKLKARLASAALRGETTSTELAAQFKQIDDWARARAHNPEVALFQSGLASAGTPCLPPLPAPRQQPVRAPAPARSKAPTLPGSAAFHERPAVAQAPTRLRAPTLPGVAAFREPPSSRPAAIRSRPWTLPARSAFREQPAGPRAPTRSTAPTAPSAPAFRELPAVGLQSQALPDAPPEDTFDDDFWEEKARRASGFETGERIAPGAPAPARRKRSRSWTRRLLGPFFRGWLERHLAAKVSRQLLKLYDKVAAAHPGVDRQELYRQIVMARLDGSCADADEVLDRAAESFAMWPVERDLIFRDVVHYLAVSDYLGPDDELAAWTRENLGRVVAELVSDDL